MSENREAVLKEENTELEVKAEETAETVAAEDKAEAETAVEVKEAEAAKEAVEAEAAEETAEAKPAKRKKKIRLGRVLGAAAMAVCLVLVALIAAFSMMPYGIYVEGHEVCRVSEREDASDAIADAIGSMAAEGTKVRLVKTDKDIKVTRINTLKDDGVIPVKEAASLVGDALVAPALGNYDPRPVTVICSKMGEKSFTPDPKYIKDDTMPAGVSLTLEEGEDGLGKCLYTYTVVDGCIEDSDEKITEVVSEGKREVIAKGTVGLPPGEDWMTYEGDPIFSSGDALVATAQKYKGAPYKWGGTNLKTGVSCIGFVKAIYAKYGIKIPMSHPLLKKFGVGVKYKNARPGDIICYKEHTGIYIGGGKMIDAASNRGVGIARVRPGKVVTVRRVPRS